MIITLREELFKPRLKYCGLRPRHIPYESVYSIICRFSLVNVITGVSLIKIIQPYGGTAPAWRHHSKNLAHIGSVRNDVLQELLGLSAWQVESMFLVPTFVKSERHVALVLRFCPACLAQGRHYTLFQFQLMDTCPVHGIGLLGQCPHCGASTSYEMHANLFKYPYGCWRCGQHLGAPRDRQSLHFISPLGAERLRRAHELLSLGRNGIVDFDIAGAADFQCDNVLQLSESIRQFAHVEADLFRDLQTLICDASLAPVLARYPTFRPAILSVSVAPEVTDEALAKELASIAKSIFRNFKKRNFPGLRLTRGLISMLWRGAEGTSMPAQCYSIVAYLDWLSFWRNAKVPSQLRYSAAGCEKKMLAWIAEKKMHSVFQRANTPSVERWLLRQILACDITTLLQRQLQHGLLAGQMDACYGRLIHPVCWAVYFSEGRSGKSNLTFISALSWQKSCGDEEGESTSGQYKSSRSRDWAAMLRSLGV
ncbi:TniQ family protein [Pseudomonas sp. ZT5P21]